jgi:hypothetical protein
MPYSEPERVCRSLAQLFTERRISEFDDHVMERFLKNLRHVSVEIERSASWAETTLFGEGLRDWLVETRKARVESLYRDLVRLAGEGEAKSFLSCLTGEEIEGGLA